MILNRLIYLIGVSSIAVGLLFGCSNTANVGSDEIENYCGIQPDCRQFSNNIQYPIPCIVCSVYGKYERRGGF